MKQPCDSVRQFSIWLFPVVSQPQTLYNLYSFFFHHNLKYRVEKNEQQTAYRKGRKRLHNKTKKASMALLLTGTLAMGSVLGGCTSPRETESLQMTGMYFDTVVQIEVWGGTSEIIDHCEEMCASYEQLLSPTIETSEIITIVRIGAGSNLGVPK